MLLKHILEKLKSAQTSISQIKDKRCHLTNKLYDITMYKELIGELFDLANRKGLGLSFVTTYLSNLIINQ